MARSDTATRPLSYIGNETFLSQTKTKKHAIKCKTLPETANRSRRHLHDTDMSAWGLASDRDHLGSKSPPRVFFFPLRFCVVGVTFFAMTSAEGSSQASTSSFLHAKPQPRRNLIVFLSSHFFSCVLLYPFQDVAHFFLFIYRASTRPLLFCVAIRHHRCINSLISPGNSH
jgi:hypothetical protein